MMNWTREKDESIRSTHIISSSSMRCLQGYITGVVCKKPYGPVWWTIPIKLRSFIETFFSFFSLLFSFCFFLVNSYFILISEYLYWRNRDCTCSRVLIWDPSGHQSHGTPDPYHRNLLTCFWESMNYNVNHFWSIFVSFCSQQINMSFIKI